MKYVVLILMVSTSTYAQVKFPTTDKGEIEFLKIIQVDSMTKDAGFDHARLWVANKFRSAQDVIQYESKENGRLLCKGVIDIKSNGNGMAGTIHRDQSGLVYLSLEISIKENKYRVRAYDLVHEASISGGDLKNKKPVCGGLFMTVKTWNSIQSQAIDQIESIMTDFEASTKQKKEDW